MTLADLAEEAAHLVWTCAITPREAAARLGVRPAAITAALARAQAMEDDPVECGTLRAAWRHRRAGEPMKALEECGCAEPLRHWRNALYADRRGGDVARYARKSQTEANYAAYAECRLGGARIAAAALAAGVSRRTAERYEARFKAAGQQRGSEAA